MAASMHVGVVAGLHDHSPGGQRATQVFHLELDWLAWGRLGREAEPWRGPDGVLPAIVRERCRPPGRHVRPSGKDSSPKREQCCRDTQPHEYVVQFRYPFRLNGATAAIRRAPVIADRTRPRLGLWLYLSATPGGRPAELAGCRSS